MANFHFVMHTSFHRPDLAEAATFPPLFRSGEAKPLTLASYQHVNAGVMAHVT